MKKFVSKFFVLLLLLSGFFAAAPPTHATASCEIVPGSPIRFCIGGFSTEEELNDYELKVICDSSNCGTNWIAGLKRYLINPFANTANLGEYDRLHGDNGWYVCPGFSGFDSQVAEVYKQCAEPTIMQEIRDNLVDNPSCAAAFVGGVTFGGMSLLTGGGTSSLAVASVKIAGATCIGTSAYQSLTRNLESVLHNECDVEFKAIAQNTSGANYCTMPFNLSWAVDATDFDLIDPDDKDSSIFETEPLNACRDIADPTLKKKCTDCMGILGSGTGGNKGVWTSLGCIDFHTSGFINQFLQISLGLGGGIAFLILIYGAFLFTISAGNPEAAQNAQGIITSAIVGLLMIILSVVILNFIGVSILDLPGF